MQSEGAEKKITSHNASSCTPFELRQELIRRNAFDIDEKTANYRNMLQRLMVELVKEEEQAAAERARVLEIEAEALRTKAKMEREEKKKEAIERARRRREALDQEKKEGNIVVDIKPLPSEPSTGENDEIEADVEIVSEDVFRSYKSVGRNKVFVK